MLRKMFVKDFILNGKVFLGLLWLFVWVAYASRDLNGAGMATVLGGIAATLMTVTLGAREERFHAAAVSFSLPVTRREMVRYRYIAGHVIGITAFLFTCVVMVSVPWSKVTAAQVFDPRTLMFALVTVSLTIAFGMPFVLRFGVMGLFVGLGSLQIAGLLAFVLAVVVGSALSIKPVLYACERIIRQTHESLGSAAYAVELLLAVAVLTWLSFRLSVWLIERRDV
jgi:hypothetical protein